MNFKQLIFFAFASLAVCSSFSDFREFENGLKAANTCNAVEDVIVRAENDLGDYLYEMADYGNMPIEDNKYLLYCFIRKVLSVKSKKQTELDDHKMRAVTSTRELNEIRDKIAILTSEIENLGPAQRLLSSKNRVLADLNSAAQRLGRAETATAALQTNLDKFNAFDSRFSAIEEMDKLAASEEVSNEIVKENLNGMKPDILRSFENKLRAARSIKAIESVVYENLSFIAKVLEEMLRRSKYYKIPITDQLLLDPFFLAIKRSKSSNAKSIKIYNNTINGLMKDSKNLQEEIEKLDTEIRNHRFPIASLLSLKRIRREDLIRQKAAKDAQVQPLKDVKKLFEAKIVVIDAFLARFNPQMTSAEKIEEINGAAGEL